MEEIQIVLLSKEFAEEHVDGLLAIKNLIPTPPWKKEIFLNDGWGPTEDDGLPRYGRGKWIRSWVALCGGEIVGLVICYERLGEPGTALPENSLYIQSMAVAQHCQRQGIGRLLVERVLEDTQAAGLMLIEEPEELLVTTETNGASWNEGVVEFYRNCGFLFFGRAVTGGREDVVLARAV